MRWMESVNPQDADTASGKLVERGAAHGTQPDHDHVPRFLHGRK